MMNQQIKKNRDNFIYILKPVTQMNTGQSIPIPHSEPFSHLRCGNGSKRYMNQYICI